MVRLYSRAQLVGAVRVTRPLEFGVELGDGDVDGGGSVEDVDPLLPGEGGLFLGSFLVCGKVFGCPEGQ